MKKYPYIGEFNDYSMVLFLGKGEGFVLKHPITPLYKLDSNWCEGQFKNITSEYLKDTWGVVESIEHAEFIIELCNAGGINTQGKIGVFNHFTISSEILSFYNCDGISSTILKQITIPLPPKAKEWVPEVGDKVCWGLTREGVVRSLSDGFAWIKDSQDKQYKTVYISSLTKPKSAQDLKIEELHAKLCEFNTVDNYILACDIVLGNIEGLSYK